MAFNPLPGNASAIEPDPAPAPSANEFTIVWIAYGCFYAGVLLWWPSLIGLIIGYLRRGEPGAGFISSHYGWLIRTFWWSTLAWIGSISVIAAAAAPLLRDLFRAGRGRGGGQWEIERLVTIEWSSIFAATGLATLGALALLGVYLFLLYRLVRGSLRLATGRPAP